MKHIDTDSCIVLEEMTQNTISIFLAVIGLMFSLPIIALYSIYNTNADKLHKKIEKAREKIEKDREEIEKDREEIENIKKSGDEIVENIKVVGVGIQEYNRLHLIFSDYCPIDMKRRHLHALQKNLDNVKNKKTIQNELALDIYPLLKNYRTAKTAQVETDETKLLKEIKSFMESMEKNHLSLAYLKDEKDEKNE